MSLRQRSNLPRCRRRSGWALAFAASHFYICSHAFAALNLASGADMVRILRDERFELIHRVRQISARDWASAGVLPRGRNIISTMVDPGKAYERADFGTGKLPERQLLVAARSARHEILCFWQGTIGGPVLRVMMSQRDGAKSTLVFYAVINNDIPQNSWTWEQVKRHIVQNKMDVLISAEHPGSYDNRLP